MNLNILNQTGGLRYHLRALLNKKKWQPFRNYVEAWSLEWAKKDNMRSVSTLVLIGPNAGYTLSKSFISLFQNIIVVEPDPIAFALFEARMRVGARWVHQDFFDLNAKSPNPNKLNQLFGAYPNAAFLFCNVLGQLPVLLRDNKKVSVEDYMQKLAQVFAEAALKYKIASYHDRYSTHVNRKNELVDHLTGQLFSKVADKKEFPWKIANKIEHQIEFVRT